jgi:NitT/TauT family transport system ATP-binding protein
MSDKNIIEIRGVSKTFKTEKKTVEALSDISLEIKESEFVSIIGASGCGKSTLLRIIGGLEKHDAGEVLLGGNL